MFAPKAHLFIIGALAIALANPSHLYAAELVQTNPIADVNPNSSTPEMLDDSDEAREDLIEVKDIEINGRSEVIEGAEGGQVVLRDGNVITYELATSDNTELCKMRYKDASLTIVLKEGGKKGEKVVDTVKIVIPGVKVEGKPNETVFNKGVLLRYAAALAAISSALEELSDIDGFKRPYQMSVNKIIEALKDCGLSGYETKGPKVNLLLGLPDKKR